VSATAPSRRTIRRFSIGELALHWLLASAFLVMLASGLVLLVPALSGLVDRPTAKAVHIDASLALLAGTALVLVVHWPRMRRTLRQLDRFDRDDLRWLREAPRRVRRGGPAPPQGRFNAGQKLNSALVGGLMVVAYATGGLLWLGERDTAYRFAGTVIVHDWVMWLLVALTLGHLYMALVNPATRPAMRGITTGSVDLAWAAAHHEKWVDAEEPPAPAPAPALPAARAETAPP
jgi:formate dehydrogenase subunit gamma